ncbi:polyamine aminopropyltransferase [Leptospira johnsonii]|uniref:Polyamine aminopropyltransferase n=1 Tax=Leptospira johnsonii TaxID=1917820 RepID=A0A2P2D6X0_9LEPT|nr:polyamine aminopropyltransferase [Leptospira johnsonii]GBF40389.1 spermidine synthase [Leptospira johnsonii]
MELWLDETLELPNGRALKIRVKEFLHSRKTPFQKIDVFESQSFGRMFTLDGVVMMTEADEFAYHEMIAHVPMMSHPNPEKVLVIGGGDGGTVREILKHPSVKEVHLCEIDKGVVDVCYEYFPEIANAMKDPRVVHAYEDGAKYVQDYKEYFDVICVDSSDPVGPAEVLFKRPFYETMAASLKQGGICTTQAESFYYHGKVIKELFQFIPQVFDHCGYYFTVVPTYPSGIIGFTYCSKGPDPYKVEPDPKRVPKGLKYYSAEIHKAAFTLPPFAQEYIVRK